MNCLSIQKEINFLGTVFYVLYPERNYIAQTTHHTHANKQQNMVTKPPANHLEKLASKQKPTFCINDNRSDTSMQYYRQISE